VTTISAEKNSTRCMFESWLV